MLTPFRYKFVTFGFTIVIITVIFMIYYILKNYNFKLSDSFSNYWISDDSHITKAHYIDMMNASFIANAITSPGQKLITNKTDTVYNVPDELEIRKHNAMKKMNHCYEVSKPNDRLNAIQMNRGALLVLP